MRGAVAASLALVAAVGSLMLVGLAGAVLGSAPTVTGPVSDIPPDYLAAYRSAAERFELGSDGWSFLAAIGKIESDHGRSTAPGVSSGQNFHGCCAGPMQIHNGYGSGGGTWAAVKVDGDHDGRLDIYDVDDAVASAAHYLRMSGAPRRLAASRSSRTTMPTGTSNQVLAQAREYRSQARLEPSTRSGPIDCRSTGLRRFPGSPASDAIGGSSPTSYASPRRTGST